MKIHSLRFTNLNAIKGSWHIDFDAPDFQNNSLFAITGPTGSGKTTLLDAISLALYHETPRQGKVSGDNQIMTRHTGICSAEVEFSVNKKRYRSFWSQKRAHSKPQGKLQGPTCELAEVGSTKPITSHLSEKVKYVEKLTGLNYDRFTRSVLLAQGAFTAFLNAKEGQRSAILEQITGTEIYRQIGQKVYTKVGEARKELDLLKAKQEGAGLLSEVEIAEKKKLEIELTSHLNDLKKQTNSLMAIVTWLGKISTTESQLKAFNTELEQAQKNHADFAANQKKLDKYAPALLLKEAFNNRNLAQLEYQKSIKLLEEKLQKKNQTQASVEHSETVSKKKVADLESFKLEKEVTEKLINDQIVPLDNAITQSNKDTQEKETTLKQAQLNEKLVKEELDKAQKNLHKTTQELQANSTWLANNIQLKGLDQKLSLIEQNIKTITDQEKESRRKNSLLTQKQTDLQTSQKKIEKQADDLQKQATQFQTFKKDLEQEQKTYAENLADDTIEALQKNLEELIRNRTLADQLPKQAQNLRNLQDNIANLEKNIREESATKTQLEKDLEALRKAMDKSQKLVHSCTQVVEQEKRIQSLEEQRHLLKDGAECPLCGSLEHPWAVDSPKDKLSQAQQDFENASKTLEEEKKQIQETEIAINSSKNSILHAEKNLKTSQQTFTSNQESWLKQTKELQLTIDFKDEDLVQKSVGLFSNRYQKANKRLHALRQEEQSLNKLRKKVDGKKTELTAAETQLKLDEQNFQNAEKSLKAEAENLVNLQIQIDEKKAVTTEILRAFKLTTPEAGKEDQFLAKLQQIVQEFAHKNASIQQLQTDSAVQKTSMETSAKSLEEKKSLAKIALDELAQAQKELQEKNKQRQSLFGDKNVEAVRKSLIATLGTLTESCLEATNALAKEKSHYAVCANNYDNESQRQEKLEAAKITTEEAFSQELESSDFTSEEDFKEALLDEATFKNLKKLADEIKAQLTIANTRVSDSIKEIQTLKEQKLSDKGLDVATNEYELAKEQEEKISIQLNELKFILNDEKEKEKVQQKLHDEIAHQEIEYNKFKDLEALIGCASGKKFSSFAQGITFDHLISLANNHLPLLTERYILQREGNLELSIIDTYQADTSRPVSTLSGGESFLVSLALALGLSDLASDKINIDSLFLDEGFGTLDGDTLDVALDALDRLQNSGKMIGIISHVEALKSRIDLQIKLTTAGGVSSLDPCFKSA